MKHKYLTKDEWNHIKDFLKSGELTQREIAFSCDRSDQTVKQVKKTTSFDDYQLKYQKLLVKKIFKTYERVKDLDNTVYFVGGDKYIYKQDGEIIGPYGWVKKILDNQKEILEQLEIIKELIE